MKDVSENELMLIVRHCQRYTRSLQYVLHARTGKHFHDNTNNPLQHVYLCPICLVSKVAILSVDDLRADDEFTIDHFPPKSVNGKGKIMVCKTCNNNAGKDYDYTIKDWIQEQAFVHGIEGAKMPVSLQITDGGGRYRESLVSVGAPMNFNFDRFIRYPKMKEWFEQVLAGKSMITTLRTKSVSMNLLYKALTKAAYLKAFSIWGYDFIYTDTGIHMRDVFFKNDLHPLTNFGVFFHMDKTLPPEGLSYVFQPASLQSFVINFEITDPETKYSCGVSVLIPGDYLDDWNRLINYQPIIDSQGSFNSKMIRLPEDTLTESEHFPYTKTWHDRVNFRIAGVHDQPYKQV